MSPELHEIIMRELYPNGRMTTWQYCWPILLAMLISVGGFAAFMAVFCRVIAQP